MSSPKTAAGCLLLFILFTIGSVIKALEDSSFWLLALFNTALLAYVLVSALKFDKTEPDKEPEAETDETETDETETDETETDETETDETDDEPVDSSHVSRQYFELSLDQAKDLKEYLDSLQNDSDFIYILQHNIGGIDVFDQFQAPGGYNPRLYLLFLCDLTTCYTRLGHKLDMSGDGLLCLAMLQAMLLDDAMDMCYDYYVELEPTRNLLDSAATMLQSYPTFRDKTMTGDYDFYMPKVLGAGEPDMIKGFWNVLNRFANFVANADGVVDQHETNYLAGLLAEMSTVNSSADRSGESEAKPGDANDGQSGEHQPAQLELDDLIGLDAVKADVKKLTSYIKIQQFRQKEGLKTTPISYHCVFTGNPGTGKTTVARIIANVYRDLGVLTKGHLVETDRSGLVAEYVGQTAVKTSKIIDSALDGVLFIDEAYSLVQGGSSNDYGIEAISTLLKRMEDDRERLVVILAGYGNEMKTFIDANPGLQSRFNRYIHFEDYTADELMKIFETNVSRNDYTLTADAREKLRGVIENAVSNKDKNFGNARFVRNLFEKALENQATRLAFEPDITKDMLMTLTAPDIPG